MKCSLSQKDLIELIMVAGAIFCLLYSFPDLKKKIFQHRPHAAFFLSITDF